MLRRTRKKKTLMMVFRRTTNEKASLPSSLLASFSIVALASSYLYSLSVECVAVAVT
jgi:hypothetical protein